MNQKAESDLDGSITKAEFNVKMVISDVFGARDGPRSSRYVHCCMVALLGLFTIRV